MRNKEHIAYAHSTKIENGSLYCWVGVGDAMSEEKTGKNENILYAHQAMLIFQMEK